MTRGILDTSTIVDLPRVNADDLPDEPLITTITLAELTIGPLVARTDHQRAARQSVLQQAEATFEPLPFDAQAARAFGRVAAALRSSGRKPQARSLDALIAAIAISHGIPIHTANPDDFASIDELTVVPVRRIDPAMGAAPSGVG